MQVRLSSGNYDIIASNEVFLYKDCNELTFQINDDDDSRSQLIMRFLQDETRKSRVDVEPDGDYVLILSCFNFFDRFAMGLKEPLLIGESMSKNVYLIFSTKQHDKQALVRSVRFTLYREK
ncbi:MAG: hypothetical protein IJO05_05410 [Oscillospiraceae bacterium]|nr:hypothetical protein [Oscillospiraceae bacterium]